MISLARSTTRTTRDNALLLLLLLGFAVIVSCQLEPSFDGCDVADYYSGLNMEEVQRSELQDLLEQTHRRVLPYTDNDGEYDVWKALIDLDVGETAGTVRLLYSQVSVPALPHGTPETWNREHLWPKSLGVEYSGADFVDIHHLRPADWNVNSARNNLFFGNCNNAATCISPAAPEAANDTAKNSQEFRPPAVTRGDIARALFYMDVRYSGQDDNSAVDLQLTDCPSDDLIDDDLPTYMAYLSVLLKWHEQDPVSTEERRRNDRACAYWQGNRNPFVDFPELLVPAIFGPPQSRPYQCGDTAEDASLNPSVTATTVSPTPAPNRQQEETLPPTTNSGNTTHLLEPGDVLVVAMHSDNPDLVALVALEDVPVSSEICITDNAWTGNNFRSNEGTLSLTAPENIPKGTVFGYGNGLLYGDKWSAAGDRGFSLSAAGDTVLIYWKADDDVTMHHLGAFSFSGPWLEPGLDADDYGTDSSALPDSLADFEIHFPHADNFVYVGPVQGTKLFLQAALLSTSNWSSSNTDALFSTFATTSFVVQPSSATFVNCRLIWLTLAFTIPLLHFSLL